MEPGTFESKPINRLGLVFGCLAIVSLVLETGYESAKIANIACNLVACVLLQRETRGRLWTRLSLIATLMGFLTTATIFNPNTFDFQYDLGFLTLSSGWSTFFLMVYFSALGRRVGASGQAPGAGRASVEEARASARLSPNAWAVLMIIGGIVSLFISGATDIEAISGLAVPLLMGAPFVFLYGLLRGITQEAKRSRQNEDSDSELPVL